MAHSLRLYHHQPKATIMNVSELATTLAQLVSKYVSINNDEYCSAAPGFKDFKTAAELHGFTFLGAGYFSAAFTHSSCIWAAIKVGFKREDSGAAYAAYCRANQGKAGIPVIRDIQRHEDCYTVVMDRYTELSDDPSTAPSVMFKAVRGVIERGDDINTAANAADLGNCSATLEECSQRESYLRNLLETAKEIRAFFNGIAEFDCHDGNVMVNGTGELFITDPISFTKGIKGWDAIDKGLDVEAIRLENHIAMCKKRHERKANRAAYLKGKRKVNAARYRRFAERRRMAPVRRMDMRIMHKALTFIPSRIRWDMDESYINNKARKVRDADHENMMNNRPLMIDKKLDAMFMG
ncbi:serine-threonine kinase [Dickeya phage Dagda]|uniref:Protein kinase n=2 Tax=Aarhusvirus dagda TaxID=2732762 RepID=A0A346NSV6_9CAUD|nr:serine-threonine kinase [Dickeya phage Dagda]AXR70220.1 protein kinase [Dickeya phage Dagda]AXY81609.1 protein kinase [Dickeya phage Dagda_B1]